MTARGLLLALGLLWSSPWPVGAAASLPCPLPPDFGEAARPLPAVAHSLPRGPLRILILGSASVSGAGGSGPEASWPAQLEAQLSRRFPSATIEVAVRGGRGVSVQDHLVLLQAAGAAPPALVIWQAGTVEATRGTDPEEMTDALVSGLERIRRDGADALLIEPQFSRFLRANSNIEPYREKLRLAAAGAGAPMLRRWDLMQHWIEHGGPDLERTPRGQRIAAADRLNECIAHALAELIAQGVAEAR